MGEINLCTMVFNNYNGLAKLIETAEAGTVKPDHYYIIDNGKRFYDLNFKIDERFFITVPNTPMGAAESWNYFIKNTKEDRIITNDDIELTNDSLEKMVKVEGDFIYALSVGWINHFSFFLIRDSCVNKVGLFDEAISPHYFYFEDNDYSRRMGQAGVAPYGADCNVIHVGSQTLNNFTSFEKERHHQKFRTAESNYKRKWGGLPGQETYIYPYNM